MGTAVIVCNVDSNFVDVVLRAVSVGRFELDGGEFAG